MEKIILCRTAWMKYYEGRASIDIPRSGAKYIKKHKTGGEIYNFKKRSNNKVYGYFPNIGYVNQSNLEDNNLGRDIKGVTVVFCATHPSEGGIRVVGWYKNANVYAEPGRSPNGNWVHTEALYKNVCLIPENDRIFNISGTFGRSSLYYFSLHKEKRKLLAELNAYIKRKGKIEEETDFGKNKKTSGKAYQPDQDKKLLVEKKAINLARSYYKNRYGKESVSSVENENKGWDLEVRTKSIRINIEVKGQSGESLLVELTPNEYKEFIKGSNTYQLFVANNVLSRKPIVRVFKYQSKGNCWVGNDKSILNVSIVKSARLNLVS